MSLPLALLLLGILLTVPGCGPRKPVASEWKDAGFINHVPADAEGFLSLHRPAQRWGEISQAWGGLLSDAALRESWLKTPWGQIAVAALASPQQVALGETLTGAGQEEVFIVLGRGTASQLAAVQQVKRLFEAARLRNLFTPPPAEDIPPEPAADQDPAADDLEAAAFTEVTVPLPPVMEAALQKFVADSSVPPILVGAKIPEGGGGLPAFFESWAEGLPEKFPREKFAFGPEGGFTRVRIPVSGLVPREAALRARNILAAQIGDPYTATRIVRALLAKTAFISFGRARGYFLVSIASDEAPPALAENFEASLAASPAMTSVAPLLGPEGAALFYADALIVGLAASPPPVNEYLDAAIESAQDFAPEDRIGPLRAAADPIRKQAAELFKPRVVAASGIIQHGQTAWRAEVFGGSLAPRLAADNARPLLEAPQDLALLWTEHWQEGYAGRLMQFAGAFSAFSADWMASLGPVFLNPEHLPWTGRLLGALQQPAARLAGIDPGSWDRAFDRNMALAVGLDGVMPGSPLLPAAARKALLPRVAIAAGLRDRGTLEKNWQSIATASSGSAGRPWPEPLSIASPGGGICYEYPLPLGGPDLGLSVTLENKRWVLGTSALFTQALAAAPPAQGGGCIQAVRIETAALATFASAWADALEADPGLAPITWGLIPANPATLRAAAAILHEPRRFHYEARWEGKILRRVLELAPAP